MVLVFSSGSRSLSLMATDFDDLLLLPSVLTAVSELFLALLHTQLQGTLLSSSVCKIFHLHQKSFLVAQRLHTTTMAEKRKVQTTGREVTYFGTGAWHEWENPGTACTHLDIQASHINPM